MSNPYDGWALASAAPAVVDTSGWTHVPAGTDWVQKDKKSLEDLDARLAGSVGETKPTVDPGGVGAIGHGLQEGVSLGFAPKIDAAVYAALTGHGSDKSFGERYQEQLSKNRSEGETLKEAHPVLHTTADLAGGLPYFAAKAPILSSALGGGARSAGESENVLGEKGTNLQGAAETAGGAAAGALTAYALPKVFGRLAAGRGKAADEAATNAVTFGTQTARDKFNRAMQPALSVGATGEPVPGEVATILKEAGAVGGLRGQRGTLEGIQDATAKLGGEFGDLIHQAAQSHPGVPITSATASLSDALEQNLANDSMEKVAQNFSERLSKVADKNGVVPHDKLQDVLETLNKTARKIYGKPPRDWSENNEAFIAGYRALRDAQAQGLEAATGRNANDLRKYMATIYGLEPVAEKAVNRFEGNDPVGLPGALEKQKGSTSIGHGLILTATGHPLMGAPVALKGIANLMKGQYGKASSPLRNNIATSVNLALQKPLNALSDSELAQYAASRLASGPGGELAGAGFDMAQPTPQEEPIPVPTPEVAQALPRTMKRKK